MYCRFFLKLGLLALCIVYSQFLHSQQCDPPSIDANCDDPLVGQGAGGVYRAPRVVTNQITIDGDSSDWALVQPRDPLEQNETNSESLPINNPTGRNHEISFAWDDERFYVLVEESTVDASSPFQGVFTEGIDPGDWALGLRPWTTDSVGFYDAPTFMGGPRGPGPSGSTGPVTQFWVGMASDGDPGRHMARLVPENAVDDHLIPGQAGVSITEEGLRTVEFYMDWADIKFSCYSIEESFCFRLDPLMVDGIKEDGGFRGQSFPGGATTPAGVTIENMSFVELVASDFTLCSDNNGCDVGEFCARADGDCDGSGTCQPLATGCGEGENPVCGCDGNTYPSACDANAAGVNVDTVDNCPMGEDVFLRADSNGDGTVNLPDAQYLLNFLFLGGPDPKCEGSADANGDDNINLPDAQYVLNFLFLGGSDPVAPFPSCGDVSLAGVPGCTTPLDPTKCP